MVDSAVAPWLLGTPALKLGGKPAGSFAVLMLCGQLGPGMPLEFDPASLAGAPI
jgi:hypothetical protein